MLSIFTMGRYVRQGENVLLPLSVQLHHAVCDGYRMGVLFNGVQLRADTCLEWPAEPQSG